nr:2-dehydropantoate 2-reductase [Paracraurococcus ruber]
MVWGAGAIGGTVGAYLRRAGHDITFVDTDAAHVAAIARDGLRITGPIEQFTVRAPAFTPADVTGVWDRIFLCVKAQHTRAASEALAPHLAPGGYVLSLQNGLCEEVIAGVVGPERVVGAFINFGADWQAPGEVQFANHGAVVLGETDGRMTKRLSALHAEMLEFAPHAIMTDDIHGYLWGKLGYGILLFAQALGQLGIADCLARPELLPLWRSLGAEVNAVAAALGVQPRGFNGYDPAAFRPGASEAAARESVVAMVAFNRPNAKTHSGIWRDIAVRKRTTEVDAQIAPIAAIGAKHGIPCPVTQRLVDMIHAVEQGRLPQADANLDALMRG